MFKRVFDNMIERGLVCGCINGGATMKFRRNADIERTLVGFFGLFSFFNAELQIVVNRFMK